MSESATIIKPSSLSPYTPSINVRAKSEYDSTRLRTRLLKGNRIKVDYSVTLGRRKTIAGKETVDHIPVDRLISAMNESLTKEGDEVYHYEVRRREYDRSVLVHLAGENGTWFAVRSILRFFEDTGRLGVCSVTLHLMGLRDGDFSCRMLRLHGAEDDDAVYDSISNRPATLFCSGQSHAPFVDYDEESKRFFDPSV